MENNIFEQATRRAPMFPTSRGSVRIDQLWDMPLTSRDDYNLDTVAQKLDAELTASTEKSFVKTNPNPKAKLIELQLEVVKHIIAVLLAEKEEAKNKAEKKAKREKLIAALANQEEKELANLSPEQIRAKLAELDAE